jgi:hypothetical protein
MADSGALRGRKPESVQFWLAIAAVSLLFHALLIVGIKRWVTIAVVEPDAGPIAVELVDPVGNPEPQGEPIVQAATIKPKVKPDLKPEVKPDLKSEVQPEPEIKPEPIVQPEVKTEIKKVQPAIVAKKERRPQGVSNPSRTEQNDHPPIKSQNNTVSPEKISNPPSTSQDRLIPPGAEHNGIKSVISRAGGEPIAKNTGSFEGTVKKGAKMAVPIFTTYAASEETLPTNFPLPLNKTIRLTVYFCVDSQGNANEICDPTLDTNAMNEVVQSLNLNSSQRDQLDIFVSKLIKSTKFPKPSLGSDAANQPKESEWSVVLEITGQ